ncbi:MAG: hypothetical protein JXB26_03130 [Candidatus Aminicenantes bacterium]|nr:hypothetical protein [Candidatus Aminicenantes bacterium]
MKNENISDLPFLKYISRQEDESERVFDLYLPILVIGTDAFGYPFQERTQLSEINSQKVTLTLRSRVTIGAGVKLMLDIPKTLLLKNQLKLILSGKVDFAQLEADSDGKQIIKIRLDKKFHIHPLP